VLRWKRKGGCWAHARRKFYDAQRSATAPAYIRQLYVNNIAERTLRQIGVGRKNWLFAGSADGARTAATLFTIASTCHRRRIDVFAYLHDILQRLAHDPAPKPEQLRDWLPECGSRRARPTLRNTLS
jgi:hypothetical protein